MNYYRNNAVAISREAMTMLRWRATAENQTRDKMDPQASVDKLADSIILEWFERHLPQLKHKLALRQQLDDEAVAAAAKLSPVASQPTNQSLSGAHNAHLAAGD